MRPDNNRSVDWEEITLDPATMRGTFKLDQHKNVNKGIKARGPIARAMVEYLLSIRPANASGPIHANADTGRPYVDIRKQCKRLLAIADEMFGYEQTGKKARFLNFRHTGASHIASRGRAARHLLGVVKMMGDTSVAIVNRHYFNLEDDVMQEIIEGWALPMRKCSRRISSPFALRLRGRSRPRHAGGECVRSSNSKRRAASQMSEHPALPFSVTAFAPALFALLSNRFLAAKQWALFARNTRDLHCYSVCFAAAENSHLVWKNLVRVVFALRAAAKHETPRSRGA
jgi:hypothetical protein